MVTFELFARYAIEILGGQILASNYSSWQGLDYRRCSVTRPGSDTISACYL